ncbi:hypothetical protein EKH55_4873 [Sinorhizobium alkalisoli]|nr:hypothetical protein EKH55_4873 [Sinorhizobium alkalisoli]
MMLPPKGTLGKAEFLGSAARKSMASSCAPSSDRFRNPGWRKCQG